MRVHVVLALAMFFIIDRIAEGQLMVNDPYKWHRSGLSVTSAQTVTGTPTRVRLFTTLWATESNGRDSLKKLSEFKQNAQRQLESIGAIPASIEFGPTKFLRLNSPENGSYYYQGYQNDQGMRFPANMPRTFTPYCSIKADWEAPKANDDLLVISFDLLSSIKSKRIFAQEGDDIGLKRPEIVMLLIGEVAEQQCDEALGRAFAEAKSHAKKQATFAGKKIGKIQYMNSHFVESWPGKLTYPTRSAIDNGQPMESFEDPVTAFRLAPNEVYSSTFDKLERVFQVEIQYEVE
jgi:Protein of unknown function (DUF541)